MQCNIFFEILNTGWPCSGAGPRIRITIRAASPRRNSICPPTSYLTELPWFIEREIEVGNRNNNYNCKLNRHFCNRRNNVSILLCSDWKKWRIWLFFAIQCSCVQFGLSVCFRENSPYSSCGLIGQASTTWSHNNIKNGRASRFC